MKQPAPWEVKKEDQPKDDSLYDDCVPGITLQIDALHESSEEGSYEDYAPRKSIINSQNIMDDIKRTSNNIVGDIERKPTNPKDAIGSDKLPLHLVPAAINIYASLAYYEGAVKYGAYNYRAIGVRMSVYISALERHFMKFKDGEWADEKTGVPHLSSMLACIGIILDAKMCGKLTDDRPPKAPTAKLIEALEVHIPLLKQQFSHCRPKHYTIEDVTE